MVSIKHMTRSQCLRIQQNNYCGEHDRNGNQFDYEAKGYRDEIDQRLWELTAKNVDNMVKRGSSTVGKVIDEKSPVHPSNDPTNQLNSEIERLDIQLSVMRAFNSWRYLGNELTMKFI